MQRPNSLAKLIITRGIFYVWFGIFVIQMTFAIRLRQPYLICRYYNKEVSARQTAVSFLLLSFTPIYSSSIGVFRCFNMVTGGVSTMLMVADDHVVCYRYV